VLDSLRCAMLGVISGSIPTLAYLQLNFQG